MNSSKALRSVKASEPFATCRSDPSQRSAMLRRFGAATGGNVGMIFGLSIIPVLLAVTMAIDFTQASDQKAKMDTAIDSAILFAATSAAANPTAASFSAQQSSAQTFFTSALGTLRDGVSVSPISVTISKDPNNQSTINAVGTYSGSVKTIFGTLFKPTIDISGGASASIQIPSYIDFYLLLDNSPSMGLAATQADIDKLVSLTPDKCEFACHVVDGAGNPDPNDYLSIAIKNNVKLRIDSLREATQALTQTAKSTQLKSGLNNQFRMGVYSFYSDVTVLSSNNKTNYTPDNGMLTDLNAVNAAASNLQLTPYRSDGNFFLTDFPAIYRSMNKIVTNPGDGSKPSKPEKFVFFVTDGVQDLPLFHPDGSTDPKYTQYDNTEGWGHAIAPIDSNICTALKNRGVKIAVLYTPFLATSAGASPLSDKDIVFWKNDIPAKLQGCASPNFFYTATSAGIAAAMNQMFQDALRSARLTQ